jgi:hypothetical protein
MVCGSEEIKKTIEKHLGIILYMRVFIFIHVYITRFLHVYENICIRIHMFMCIRCVWCVDHRKLIR